MIEISGIIGISILKKNNKYYIIFYDDHTNINYCNNKLFFISDVFHILHNNINDIGFFIEDYKENQEKNYLWKEEEGEHLKKFNKMITCYKNMKNWFFTDIRLYISDNIGHGITNLDYLFNITDTTTNENLKELKKKFNSFFISSFILNLFNFLKKKFINIKNTLTSNQEDIDLYRYFFKGYLINNTTFNDKIYELDTLIDALMELYTIAVINFNKKQINILNYGLLHSVNFVYYLKQSNCEVIYEDGITETIFNNSFLLDNLENKTKSCINIDINNINEIITR